MAALAIGDVVEIVLTWDTPLVSVAQNVWHMQMVSGAGGDTDDLLAPVLTQLQVAFAVLDDSISDEFAGVLLELRKWDFVNDRWDGVDTLAVTLMVGLSAVDYLPHQVAGLGRIVTAAARRQGRTFVPGFIDSAIANGVFTVAAEANLAGYLAIFDTDVSIAGALLSWCTFNVDPLSPLFETASLAVQTVIANSLPSALGKRKPGVGL